MSYNTCVMQKPMSFEHTSKSNLFITQTIEKCLCGLVDKVQTFNNPRVNGISTVISGYTEEKDKKESIMNQVYLMTQKNVFELVNPFNNANQAINEIAAFSNNWNGNGAEKFSDYLIEKARRILADLVAEPFVCPTACGAIQMEYEKITGEYLEFEIYEDRIKLFSIDKEGHEVEDVLYGLEAINKMKQLVVDFYG